MTKSTKKTTARAAGDEKPAAKKKATVKKAAVKKTATTGKAAAKPTVKKQATKKKAAPKKKTAAAAASTAAPKPGIGQATARKKTPASTTAKRPEGVISGAQRHAMIAEAAYLRAEAHGFTSDSHNDWVHAESEIDARLARDGILVRN